MSDIYQQSLTEHKKHKGKLKISSKVSLKSKKDLSLYYSPGVAAPCKAIAKNTEDVFEYTGRGNLVAVISDGSAVLGLGNIGPEAALPVMEGKCILFKEFGDVDAIPLCLKSQEVDDIVNTIVQLEPCLGGINLEDISAPRCFEIEEKLKQRLKIPVFHDDQHGTAIVLLAGLINATQLAEKNLSELKVVISGAGAAGIAITELLLEAGIRDIIVCDSKGAICGERSDLNAAKQSVLQRSNPRGICGSLSGAIQQADVFVGVSKPNILTKDDIRSMSEKPLVFAMSNPEPEIHPQEAKEAGAFIVATGRSDFPNQLNNVLVFPGIFRGVFDSGARFISTEMKIAAAHGLAKMVKDLSPDKIIPSPFNPNVAKTVAEAVKACATVK